MFSYVFTKMMVQRIVYWSLIFVYFMLLDCTYSNNNKHRAKRYVVFTRSSKFFFRLNGKDTMINRTDIFAHGWSIRVNYDLPSSLNKRQKLFKRDVHREIANIPNGEALQGFSCIFKHLCETLSNIETFETCGFLCQMGNIIKRSQGSEADFFRSFVEKCDYHSDTCPEFSKDLVIDSFG